MKLKNNLLIVVIVLLVLSCDGPADNSFSIKNESKDTLLFMYYKNDTLMHLDKNAYDDKKFYFEWAHEIPTNTEEHFRMYGKRNEAWRIHVKEYCKDQKLRLWIFDKDTLRKYSSIKVLKEERYKKKYLLSYDTLERLNWRVIIK